MRSISCSFRATARRLLCLAIALAVSGVALGLRGAARREPDPPARPALVSGSLAPGPQSPGQHGPRIVHFDLLAKLLADDRRSKQGEWCRELDDPLAACRVETQSHPLLGHAAPDFTLRDHLGQRWNLGEQVAQGPVVVVFYLGYSCNACVHHLCELSADLERFHELGAQVVAISADPPELTRQRFAAYGALGFAVLSDPDHAVARQFGTLRPAAALQGGEQSAIESTVLEQAEPDQPLHGTFIIDRHGDVRWATRGEAPFRSDTALLYELHRLDRPASETDGALPAQERRP